MDQITIVFAGINDHLHIRGLLSRLREQSTADLAVWLEIKDVLESMREIMVVLKVPENTHEASVCFVNGICAIPGRAEFFLRDNYAPVRGKVSCDQAWPKLGSGSEKLETTLIRMFTIWSDISYAMRGLKDDWIHMLVLDKFQQLTQNEARNRCVYVKSDSGYVE